MKPQTPDNELGLVEETCGENKPQNQDKEMNQGGKGLGEELEVIVEQEWWLMGRCPNGRHWDRF